MRSAGRVLRRAAGALARVGRGVAAFARAPAARKRLALEAGWELLRARLDTLRSAEHFTGRMGRSGEPSGGSEAANHSGADEALAVEVGIAVAAAAGMVPFRARCLQQALAVRRMLDRRGVPAVVHLGVARDREGDLAHAWVVAGRRVVIGDGALDRYVVIGTFS